MWKMLFAYLAISKIIYWANVIANALNPGDIRTVGEAILFRFLNQDILVIAGVFIMFYMERAHEFNRLKFSKLVNEIITHIIAYMLFMVACTVYFVTLFLVGMTEELNLIGNLIFGTLAFVTVVIVFEIKQILKNKNKPEYNAFLSKSEKLTMLKTMYYNGVLTEEEYEKALLNI